MTERDWEHQFEQELDRLIAGLPAGDQDEMPGGYRHDLATARRLAEADFSLDSHQQTSLERRLLVRARARRAPRSGSIAWDRLSGLARSVSPAVAWGLLALLLVAGLSWTIANLLPTPTPELPSLNLAAQLTPTPVPTGSPEPTSTASSTGQVQPATPPATSTAPDQAVAALPAVESLTATPAVETLPAATQSPVLSPTPTLAPLTRRSTGEQIRARLLQSQLLWQSLWADVQVITTENGTSVYSREQVWFQQPSHGLWLSGPEKGDPQVVRLQDGALTVQVQLETGTRRLHTDARLVPNNLDKMLFPDLSLASRPGTFEATGEALVADRWTVVVDYRNVEGVRVDRFWVDALTGVVLRWAPILPARAQDHQKSGVEIVVKRIVYDADFPPAMFDLQRQPPEQFAPDYRFP
jgi:hypothetical protein